MEALREALGIPVEPEPEVVFGEATEAEPKEPAEE